VVKEKSLDKKNLVRIRLTDKGEAIYHQAIGMKPMHEIISVLSKEERQELKTLLGKLRDRAQQNLGRKYKLPYEALK
jgi:DNA-binding MarR family transcriptional regulator